MFVNKAYRARIMVYSYWLHVVHHTLFTFHKANPRENSDDSDEDVWCQIYITIIP